MAIEDSDTTSQNHSGSDTVGASPHHGQQQACLPCSQTQPRALTPTPTHFKGNIYTRQSELKSVRTLFPRSPLWQAGEKC